MGLGIYIEVTNACNLRCKTCLPSSAESRIGELTAHEIVSFLEKFRDNGAESVFFTGGEPFLRADFLDILQSCKDLGFSISVVTNGTLINDSVISVLKEYRVTVSISLDGASSEIHDQIRGKGTFDKTIGTLQKLINAGIKVETAFTVNRQNFDHIGKIAEMSRQMGCWRTLYTEVVDGGRARDNWDSLALTIDQRVQLPIIVERVATDIFGDDHFGSDDSCWVDGSSLFIDSTGLAYLCVEIFQRRKEFAIANVKTETGINKVIASLKANHTHRLCCYELYASKNVTLIANLDRPCAVVELIEQKLESEIQNIGQLNREFDQLWTGIEKSCANCIDPDCIGYISIMPEEEDSLLDAGIQTVQINGIEGPIFIDSYPRDKAGALIVNQPKPPCPHRDQNGLCSIHAIRPLVCHMWPIGIETTIDGDTIWALHTDCHHVRSLIKEEQEEMVLNQIRAVLKRISPPFRDRILNEYKKVDSLSFFPDGLNSYIIVEKV